MIAQHQSTCPDCGHTVHAGDRIVEMRQLSGDARGWAHATCPTDRTTTVCTTCFLQTPCPCDDEQ